MKIIFLGQLTVAVDAVKIMVCRTKYTTSARTAGLKWKIMEIMNKYIQQFLDDNDLQAGERFYILDKDYKDLIIQEEE